MFTSLAAAAGVTDVNAQVMRDKKQYIDGVDNLDWWLGKSTESKRSVFFYYYESKMMAVRMGPWKWHFATKEDYYAPVVARTAAPLVYNVRADPFESYSSIDSYGHLLQKSSWQLAPLGEIMNAHLKTLIDYPPVQGGNSFDMSNIVQETLSKRPQ